MNIFACPVKSFIDVFLLYLNHKIGYPGLQVAFLAVLNILIWHTDQEEPTQETTVDIMFFNQVTILINQLQGQINQMILNKLIKLL